MIALLGGEVKSLSHGPCLLIGNIAVRKGLVTKFQVLWSALDTRSQAGWEFDRFNGLSKQAY